jgi:hypothetical protein
VSKWGETLGANGADGISDIEGKATRAGASESGQRASFNGADGISDPPSPSYVVAGIEGKVARVAASKLGSSEFQDLANISDFVAISGIGAILLDV